MKRFLLLIAITSVTAYSAQAQFTRYIVKLKNKGNNPFSLSNPLAYLTQKAIDKRTRYGIALDSTDLPVTPSYVTQIRNVPNVTVLNVSKWLNSVTIQTSDANAITTINGLPFVQSVSGIAARSSGRGNTDKFEQEEPFIPSPNRLEGTAADYFNYGTASYNEIHLHNGEFLHNIGLRGQGMTIAMLDAGFFNYTGLRSFDSARINGQIKSTWDFVSRHASVTEDHPHGMQCLSTIAANIPGQFIGKAPKADFHLFRTEDAATEYPIEEHNWVCGAERADSLGCEIISSSLGYYDFDNATFNYVYANMNGNTTISAIGADMAAKKGMMVFNAVGNEGGNAWRFLITPSDGDSVVAVGAVNAAGVVGGFSSYGPSSDGQIKPDVASVGVSALIQSTSNTVGTGNGTSFACPNMAGLGTCLWQGFPEFNNMKIVNALRQAGHRATNPDDRVGFGIPNMKLAFSNLLVDYAISSSSVNNCRVTVSWNSKDVSAIRYEVERKAPGETNYSKIGDVAAQTGDILANRSYQFNNDLTAGSSGNFSYRIRQIIDTAAATFTAVFIDTSQVTVSTCTVTATNDPNAFKRQVWVQPNPVNDNTAILVVETSDAIPNMTVVIYDGKGSAMMRFNESKGTGKKTFSLPVEKLSKGKYYIKVLKGNKTIGTAEMLRL
ncbi:MAG: T9SS type A sorting domain-containing protein [Bacteroidetes bacterium]|nr:T9SS type A sorting domain-containing protein [Bacteroidota bacterium]